LNFGNPYKPENFWQLREAVEGAAEACRAFGTPVTGGNVSLYNESPAGVVDPTPTIGMVGLIEKEEHITTQWFKKAGDEIILIGKIGDELGGSRFLKVCHGKKLGPPPHVDLAHEIKIQNAVRDLIHQGLVKSAHDCSEGGLAVALAESCFNPKQRFGAEIHLSGVEAPVSGAGNPDIAAGTAATTLFNESQSRIVISVAPENVAKAMSILQKADVPHQKLGIVTGDELRIRANAENFRWPMADLYDDWWNSITRLIESDSSAERIPSL
jgi:phosphoribosylformylglycinamidine synthase